MGIATVTSKGQITIPADIRDELGIQPGDRIEFVPKPNGTIHLRVMHATTETFFASLASLERTDFVGSDEAAIALTLSETSKPQPRQPRGKAA